MKDSAEKLLTRPEPVDGNLLFFPTGNEYLALPETDQRGRINNLNLLRLDYYGLLEFSGSDDQALLAPLLIIDGQEVLSTTSLSSSYDTCWLPVFKAQLENSVSVSGVIAVPPGCKGFIYQLKIENRSKNILLAEAGWQGFWSAVNYIVFKRRVLSVQKIITFNDWTGSLVLEALAGHPLAALALATEPENRWQFDQEQGTYKTSQAIELKPGEDKSLFLYGAINLEADGAATTNIDLRRRGAAELMELTRGWLRSRYIKAADADLEDLLNKNLFFCYFYSTARALDCDSLAALTSRSPRYYVSAAFWSRDALLWSFPAMLLADSKLSGELLLTIYSRHIKHAGDHAHYLNGTILYPGFELDQLASYLIAVEQYLEQTGDHDLVKDNTIRKGLDQIARKALERFDPATGLYSTFLDPSDDPVDYPFLTYNNALLQRGFCLLAKLQQNQLWSNQSDFAVLALELEKAIYEHCTVKGPCGLMFAWAVDGKGRFQLYDNPPGSLQLLAHYRFCSLKETIFKNTVRWIRSPNNQYFHQGSLFEEAGSLHCSNPWPMGACNDLLACKAGAIEFLKKVKMDNGFFCETVDPVSGRVSTGAAFASAAGFLAYALHKYLSEQ